MFIITGGRGSGKTKKLLETAQENGGVIICRDPQKMIDRAHKYGMTGLDIISYEEYCTRKVIPNKPKYIHDLEAFMTDTFKDICGFSVCID